MDLNEYQKLAQRTANTAACDDKLLNGMLGLAGETGECVDMLKKYLYQGHAFPREQLIEELGDVMWYVAEAATGLKITLSELAEHNIAKLKKRYPDGFDAGRSINRDTNQHSGSSLSPLDRLHRTI